MRLHGSILLFLALAATCASSQQPTPSSAPTTPYVQHESVKVYSPGPDVTASVLLPLSLSSLYTEKCKKFDGKVTLSLLVDTAGHPRNIVFLKPLGSDLDQFALNIAGTDRFKPGTVDGKPVVVAESLDVKIQSCIVEYKDSSGVKTHSMELRSAPVQKLATIHQPPLQVVLAPEGESWRDPNLGASSLYHVGADVSRPIPFNSVEARYSDEARAKKSTGSA
jgi:hypothetical protein